MPPESARSAEAREWLVKAFMDLRGATIDLEAVPPLVEDALFHCQQAVEKALKALLAWHDMPIQRTHSVEKLGHACVALDRSLESLVLEAAPLTEYAWAYRYPGMTGEPEVREAVSALDLARRIVRRVLDGLPPEAAPPGSTAV